jgi:hypothetical protein
MKNKTNYKLLIEKLKWSKSMGKDIDRQISQLGQYIRSYFKEDKAPDFYLKLTTGEKTYPQLKAFYEAISQLLPQYNAKQLEEGKKEFLEDEFKFILKYVGGWVKEIENKNGDSIPIEKSFTKISKKDMNTILDNINRWSIDRGFNLCIDQELRDLIR